MKKSILVAAHEIAGVRLLKADQREPWTIAAGEQITASMAKSHGLDKVEIGLLRAKGAIIEVTARADSAEDRDEAIAEANERAERAESALAELKDKYTAIEEQLATKTAELADAVKPATAAKT